MVGAGVVLLWPRIVAARAGLVATAFCWLVEATQLTGIPAYRSERSGR